MSKEEFRDLLASVAQPFHEAYKEKTAGHMATDFEAVKERDAAIKAAWVDLGVPEKDVADALRRGSGAVAWLATKCSNQGYVAHIDVKRPKPSQTV